MNIVNTCHRSLTRSGSQLGQISLILFALCSASACGILDYSKGNDFTDTAYKERTLGVIHFRYGEEQPYDVTVKKIHRGFAMTTPMYEEDALHINLTASHDSESGNFVGLRSRWEF